MSRLFPDALPITRDEEGLLVLQSYADATQEERDAIGNGCGAEDATFDFVPDSIWGLDISPLCGRHDWHYHYGETWADFFMANACFLLNLLIYITRWAGKLRFLRYYRAMTYWAAVHEKGADAFWEGKKRPPDKRKRRRPPVKKIKSPKGNTSSNFKL